MQATAARKTKGDCQEQQPPNATSTAEKATAACRCTEQGTSAAGACGAGCPLVSAITHDGGGLLLLDISQPLCNAGVLVRLCAMIYVISFAV
jgi:hypothetical protein